ncbi:MAG: hypothetical protein J6V28_05725 [Tidjanibacter sp.]|nr:hypothetical protein [Tidjanibacter sp.]MBQ2248498.1 hypothetical protein [Tidjanibacter sp.]
MRKQIYERPEIEQTQCSVENGIASSETLWYEKGGEGDFDYVITDDETWG